MNFTASIIRPYFGQPGQGVRYKLPNETGIGDLVDRGYLEEVNRMELLRQWSIGSSGDEITG